MSEYLSKEEIKKWRSSVEKITLEEYAARLGKKIQEEKKTNDLADMLYTRFNPAQTPVGYDTVTKLEKIDLSPKLSSTKTPKSTHNIIDEVEAFDIDEEDLLVEENNLEEDSFEEPIVSVKKEKIVEPKVKEKKAATKKEENSEKIKEQIKDKNSTNTKKDKVQPEKETLDSLNISFQKPLTDREEKVLAYFIEKRGEIVYAKDLAELLDLKRDYIYKYIKNLRAKMTTDIIVNADNGGFKID